MKKYIAFLTVALFALALSGCHHEEKQIQNQQAEMNQQNQPAGEIDPLQKTKKVSGDDETSKAVNEIDALLKEADTNDLDDASLDDSSLGL